MENNISETVEADQPQSSNNKEDEDLECMQILDSIQADDECAGEDAEDQGGDEGSQGDDAGNEGDTSLPTDAAGGDNSNQKEGNDKGQSSKGPNAKVWDTRRMSGAARKRYKYFISQGHDRDEARKLALDRTVKITDWSKLEEELAKKARLAEEAAKAEAETLKVGILPENYPLVSFSREEMETIQGDILNKVLEKGGDIKPKFLGTIYKTGWFVLKCANKETAEWIKTISSELQGSGGQPLKIVDNAEVPKTIMVYAYFPKSADDTDEKVLQLIGAQNEKLNVSQWRVTHREIEGPALRLSVAIDPASDEVLQGLEYRVAYKFGFVNLRTEDKEKERKAIKRPPPPPTPKRRARSPRALTPPRRSRPPKRFERARSDRRSERRGRGGGRFGDRESGRGGSSRFAREREARRSRDDRFDSRRERDRGNDAVPYGYGSDIHPPLPKMPPPPQNYPGGWGDAPPMFPPPSNMGEMGKSNEEMNIYFTQLKSLEEYNRSLNQQQQGSQSSSSQGTWYTQTAGNAYGANHNNRR